MAHNRSNATIATAQELSYMEGVEVSEYDADGGTVRFELQEGYTVSMNKIEGAAPDHWRVYPTLSHDGTHKLFLYPTARAR